MRRLFSNLLLWAFVLAFPVAWTGFLFGQLAQGGTVYQVRDGRLHWCVVVCLPGHEEFYNHTSNSIGSEWRLFTRYRVSPWFDAGRTTTPFDNP